MQSVPLTDVGSIFQQQTVSEIENIERKIRGEIEKRKQDLRVMVGERYRDLINAADTIQDMKNVSEKVTIDLGMIDDLCANFSCTKKEGTTNPMKRTKTNDEAFYSLATQMDLLVDTPEKIWSALDNQKYLEAAQLYLLSDYVVNTTININSSQLKRGSQRDIFASFPILHHQWAAISHFKPSILKGSRNSLKDTTIPDNVLTQSLCSIVLLEDHSPRQVFNEFLLARKMAFQDLFQASIHRSSSKKQICDITHILRLTIKQIVTLFYTDDSKPEESQKPLFYLTLQDIVTNKKNTGKGKVFEELFGDEVNIITVSKFLPNTVTDFTPKLRSIPVTISISYIQKHTIEWLNSCIKEIQEGVKSLLSFINNIKGLALVRDAVYDILQSTSSSNVNDTEDQRSWKKCCQIALNCQLSIWDDVFRPLFFQRASNLLNPYWHCRRLNLKCTSGRTLHMQKLRKLPDEILEKHCNECFHNTSAMLHEILEELKKTNNPLSDACWDDNFAQFLWREFPTPLDWSDNSTNMLNLKVHGYTPSIQRLSSKFNEMLNTMIEDSQHFISEDKNQVDDEERRVKSFRYDLHHDNSTEDVFEEKSEPFDRFADAEQVRVVMNDSFLKEANKLCEEIGNLLNETKKSLSQAQFDDSNATVVLLNRATYLARVSLSLPDLCNNIHEITNHQQHQQDNKQMDRKPLKRQLSSNSSRIQQQQRSKKTTSESLQKINEQFSRQHTAAISIWTEWTCRSCQTLVTNLLRSEDEHFIFSATNWDVISIQEEGEGGEKVQSTIRVPAMPSFYLTSILYRVSEELHRVGGSLFQRSSLVKLSVGVGDAILKAHQDVLKEVNRSKVFQRKIFQFIFDLKFTMKLLAGSSDRKDQDTTSFRERCSSLIDSLQQLVDPFDLDVFTPHMDKAIQSQLQRSNLMYGLLVQSEKHGTQSHSAMRGTSNISDQATVTPLVANPPRFMLLPISSHNKEQKKETTLVDEIQASSQHPLFVHKFQVIVT